ncbi:MAG: hypothetical protein K6U14_10725 [Firmicutes bacterium]|nr:hypothetical protein [Alicyclobacillaceae bacterium]MCL6498085.1 hypothetical protein [Bacillota bacterium]
MGFGPTLPDRRRAVEAVRDIVTLLYPEHATPAALAWLEAIAAALLEARAALSFRTMAQFLADPDWRRIILERAPEARGPWAPYEGQPLDPSALDPHLGALFADRLQTLEGPPLAPESLDPGTGD